MILVLLILGISGYVFAISCANQIPKDAAEADLYVTISNRDIYGL